MRLNEGFIDGKLCAWCKGELPWHLAGSRMAMFCSRECRNEWTATKWKNPQVSHGRMHPALTPTASRRRASKLLPPSCCSECGDDGVNHVHHRDGNPMNNDLANLVRLCPRCHRRAHKAMLPRCSRCDRPARSEGLCLHHFRLWQKRDDPPKPRRRGPGRVTLRLTPEEFAFLSTRKCITCGSPDLNHNGVYCPEHDVPWIGAAQKPKG